MRLLLHDPRRGLSMTETHLSNLTKQYLDIWNKIGREKHKNDPRKIVTYIALTEYVKTIEADILQEPEYITKQNSDVIRNPDLEILEALKEEIRNIDKELRLSFWPDHKRRG